MNLYLKFQSRRPRGCGDDFVTAAFELMLEPRCYCASATSAQSTQLAINKQAATQTAPGAPGITLGAGSSARDIAATATNSGNTTLTNSNNPISNSYNTTISGDYLTAKAGLDTATALGGAAINFGALAVGGALQFAQNESVLNAKAVADNSAEWFAYINATKVVAGQDYVAASAQQTLADALASGQQMASLTALPTGTPTDTTGTGGAFGGITGTELVGIGLAVAAVAIFMHHGTH